MLITESTNFFPSPGGLKNIEKCTSNVGPLLVHTLRKVYKYLPSILIFYHTISARARKTRFAFKSGKGVKVKKTFLDDGFYPYLTEGASFVGEPGIPMLLDLHNAQIPRSIIPFEKMNKPWQNRNQYVHFYEHDRRFSSFIACIDRFMPTLQKYDGVITPDCTLGINRSKCLQQTNVYLSRAVGFYLQKKGIPVIPNVRWSDENSFEYCFLGIPKHNIVSISTHGCIRTNLEKDRFKHGLEVMLKELQPRDVLVHGYMPAYVFSEFIGKTQFHRYPSLFEQTHTKVGA